MCTLDVCVAVGIWFRPVIVWHLFIENQQSDPLSPSSIDDMLYMYVTATKNIEMLWSARHVLYRAL